MPGETAITIGNFDGVHCGHAELVASARRAVGPDGRVVVLAFDPHPLSTLRPTHVPAQLTSFQQRQKHLAAAGADEIIALKPERTLLGQTADDFIRWLVDFYRPTAIVEGPDFRFGRGRAGSIDTLRRHEHQYGYETILIDPVSVTLSDQSTVRASSSITRWLLERGRVRDARCVLGRPYEVIGTVSEGEKRGRAIGVPTANFDDIETLLPADGIYAGQAVLNHGETYPAAISIGTKPTFGEHPRVCEAHLLDYDGPLDHYGWSMQLEFHDWLRDQLRYPDTDALIDQLHRDIQQTRRVIGGVETVKR